MIIYYQVMTERACQVAEKERSRRQKEAEEEMWGQRLRRNHLKHQQEVRASQLYDQKKQKIRRAELKAL